jgi:uncharacterized protein (TIGR03435 family)
MSMNQYRARLLVFALALAANVFALAAQSPDRPKFEVASVRPSQSGDGFVSVGIQPGGRFNAVNVPLRLLIRNAYRLQDFQIVGAPDWISSQRYDIVAKAEGDFGPASPGGPISSGQLMLQSLLEERFKLAAHGETRDLPIYALVVARSDGKLGPQLRQSTTDCQAIAGARGRQGRRRRRRARAGDRYVASEWRRGTWPEEAFHFHSWRQPFPSSYNALSSTSLASQGTSISI